MVNSKLSPLFTKDNLNSIYSYLEAYWKKYPQELNVDPSFSSICSFIGNGGQYFLKNNNFILFNTHKKYIEIVFYWCDMENLPLSKVKQTLKNHKNFIKQFNKPVYSKYVKDLFKRDYLIVSDKKTNTMRWL